jgi:cytochrome c2
MTSNFMVASVGVGLVLSLSVSSNENPFEITPITKDQQAPGAQVVQGRCGAGREGMCGAMMRHILPPNQTAETLPSPNSDGARLMAHYCIQCHNLPSPAMKSPDQWPLIVERMQGRMNMMGSMMGGVSVLSDMELKVLVDYLQSHGQQPIDRSRYPDLASPAGNVFQQYCQRCHVLPDPKRHTPGEWSGVVGRMKYNMNWMGVKQPAEAETQEILRFLQSNAAD